MADLPYGMDDSMFQQVINGTRETIDQMDRLNRQVTSQAEGIAQANRSDSGGILQRQLGTWQRDFNAIRASLVHLNTKAQGVYKMNIAAAQKAAQEAGRGQTTTA